MSSKITQICEYTCAQIYGNKFGYIKAYPMDGNDKQNLDDILSLIIQDVGFMQKMYTENAPKMVGRKTSFLKYAWKEGINLTTIDPNCPDDNYGENIVGKENLGLAILWLV